MNLKSDNYLDRHDVSLKHHLTAQTITNEVTGISYFLPRHKLVYPYVPNNHEISGSSYEEIA
jgi:hypothetical protein